MSSTKTIVHFDSINNINRNSTSVFDNCILKINNPIKYPKSVVLKSFEIPILYTNGNTKTYDFQFSLSYTNPKYVLPKTLNWCQYTPLYGIVGFQDIQNIPQAFTINIDYPIYPITLTYTDFTISGEIIYSNSIPSTSFSINLSMDEIYSYTSTTTIASNQNAPIQNLLSYLHDAIYSYIHPFYFYFDSNKKVISLASNNNNFLGVRFNNMTSTTNINTLFQIFGNNIEYIYDTVFFPRAYIFSNTPIQYNTSSTYVGTLTTSNILHYTLSTNKPNLKDIVDSINLSIQKYVSKIPIVKHLHINNYDNNTISSLAFSIVADSDYLIETNSLIFNCHNNGLNTTVFPHIKFQFDFGSHNTALGLNLDEYSNISLISTGFLQTYAYGNVQSSGVIKTIKKVFPKTLTNTVFSNIGDLVNALNANLPTIPNRIVQVLTSGESDSFIYLTNASSDETNFNDWITLYNDFKDVDIFRLGFCNQNYSYATPAPIKYIYGDFLYPSTVLTNPTYTTFNYSIPITIPITTQALDDIITLANTTISTYLSSHYQSSTTNIAPTLSTQIYDVTMLRFFVINNESVNGKNVKVNFSIDNDNFINLYNPFLDGINDTTYYQNMRGILPNILLNDFTQLAGLRDIKQTPVLTSPLTQTIFFSNTFILPQETHLIAHIQNLKTHNSNASALPSTFKIPLYANRNISDTGEAIYYFQDVNFYQKLEISDKSTVLDQITISIYDRYNNPLQTAERDFAFTLEFELY